MTPSLELGWKKIHGERSARCPAACPRLAYEAPQRGSISVADSIEQMFFGAGGPTRTGDLLITNQLLYQLSYTSAPGARRRARRDEAAL
jgi:hypothetical protein